ncbi:PAS domain-containing protein [Comamonas aquatica]|uniref:PAS domain-containing protein n=1 Tax=Comamonas aquatica TaxID=225991 RepID=UPI00244AF781|nr:PAS domain-containing protein [Comamonas aquatica]MDH1813946.1 PAS domain-containing protein [Comamonas aquatica]
MPADRQVMLSAAAAVQGSYGPVTGPDGIQRMNAWSRVHDYPILVSTGLDSQAVHDPLNKAIEQSLWRNGLGTALIFLGAVLTAWLAFLRWREEDQRLQSEQRFVRLSQEVPGGLFQYGLDVQGDGVLLFSNPGFYAVHCIDATVSHGDLQALVRRVHPDDVPGLRASIAQAIEGRKAWVHKYRVGCPDGGVRWLHGHAQPQLEQDGSLLWHGYILDVTQDEALQNALRQSEERLRLTIGAVRDGLWQWDCDKDTVVWDARCYDIVGRPDQSLGTFGLSDFVEQLHPADRARVRARLEQHLVDGEPFRVEMRLRQQDGGWRWVESRGEVTLRDVQGRALRMLGMHSDIQERVDQTQLVSALLDRGSALIMVASRERQMVYANQRAAEYFGLDPHRLPESRSFSAMHGSQESFERFGPLYQRLKTDGVVRAEWELRGSDGDLCWFDMQGTLLDPSDPEGNVIWTLFDVDARHRAEAELAQTRLRMEAVIDRFPSGILVSDSRGQTILAANDMHGLHAGCAAAGVGAGGPESAAPGGPSAGRRGGGFQRRCAGQWGPGWRAWPHAVRIAQWPAPGSRPLAVAQGPARAGLVLGVP